MEGAMRHELISGDNHIDLTYCPPDLWSSRAPASGGSSSAGRLPYRGAPKS